MPEFRRPRAHDLRRDARRRGAELGLLRNRDAIGANGLGAGPVIIAGSEEQQAVAAAARGALCSFGLSEPEAGSDVVKLKTAERRGDEYVLNGSKTFITNAGHAAWTVVFAKTDPAKGHKACRVHRPDGHPGVQLEKHLDKMGQRATDSAFAHRRRRPGREQVGEEGEGFKIAMQTLDFTRPGTAAGASASRRPPTSTQSVRQRASPSTSRSRCTRASTS